MISIIYLIIVLLITVLIHELAHMVVALLCGVKIEIFSIGFGKPYLHKKIKGIDFRITPWLLGGYCQLEGESSLKKEGWLTLRYLKKLAIVFAGVTANLLVAFLCYYIQFKSIRFGLQVDYLVMKSVFIKDYDTIFGILIMYTPNLFLLQLSIMNMFACITNILPLPALDGGFIWLFPLERIYKENFPQFLAKITKMGFWVLMILQGILLCWIWWR